MDFLLASVFVHPTSIVNAVAYSLGALLLIILLNASSQLLPRSKSEPPLVFHWIPFVGNAISYGQDPFSFYSECREKYGDVFTFILLGKRMTVYLGLEGNEFILNGKLQNLNAEEIYGPLTIPVFGKDVVYDCPNAKLMEQKKFVKYGLTQQALGSYTALIEQEVLQYITTSSAFRGRESGTVNIAAAMAEITIFTAARTLQGAEVRGKLTAEFAELYHDLDLGFRPINFLMPWAPLPHNRRRDVAHAKMRAIYLDIINDRRKASNKDEHDMLWHLMSCAYKDGTPVPDKEIAHMMITLLMAGQHSSSSASSWIMLRLASQPDMAEQLLREQIDKLGYDAADPHPFEYSDIDKLPLLQGVIKETLRVHSSIHSIMRKVKNPIPVPGTDLVISTDKVLVSSPIVTHLSEEHFPNAQAWDPHRWAGKNTNTQDGSLDGTAGDEDADDMVDYGYGKVSKGTKSPFLPFGAGRHRCIGEKFAYVNLCTITATLVRNLKFGTVDRREGTVPRTDYTSLFSRPVQPALIRWERRASSSVMA